MSAALAVVGCHNTTTENSTVYQPPGDSAPAIKPVETKVATEKAPEKKPAKKAKQHEAKPKEPVAKPAAEPKPAKKPAAKPQPTVAKPTVPAEQASPSQPSAPAQPASPVVSDDKTTTPAANVTLPPSQPQPEESRIVLPVKLALAAIEQQIDALVPKEDKRDWTPVTKPGASPKADVKVQMWRDPVKVAFSDHTFHISVSLRYAAQIRAQVKNPLSKNAWIWLAKEETWGTRAEPQQLIANFDAKLDVDANWHVESDLRVVELKHGPPPSGKICKNAGVEICVSRAELAPQVNDHIDDYLRPRLEKALAKVDATVEKAFALKAHAQTLWKDMQTPKAVSIPGSKQPTWLVATPNEIGLGKPELDGSDMRIDLSISGRIAVQSGGQPKVKRKPLPELSTQQGPAGFHIIAELDVPVAALSASLRHELKSVHVGKGKQQIVVTGAQVVAQRDPKNPHRITIKVALGGAVEQEVELSGDLVIDAASQRLSVQNFDFAADSEAAIKKLADFNHEAIRKQIAAKASWNLVAEAAPLKKAIAAALNGSAGNQLQVAGELDALDVRDFTLGADALTAHVIVGGALSVSFAPK